MTLTVCEHCKGLGQRGLTAIEQVTLDAIPADWTPTGEIQRAIPKAWRPKRPALCNRLVDLERMGLVERSEQWKENRWRRRAKTTRTS